MEIDAILHQFERATGRFARTAVEAAVERRDEIAPELLRIPEETTQRAAELDAGPMASAPPPLPAGADVSA